MDAPEVAGLREVAEIPAHGVRRDVELGAQLGRNDLAVTRESFEDEIASFLGQHLPIQAKPGNVVQKNAETRRGYACSSCGSTRTVPTVSLECDSGTTSESSEFISSRFSVSFSSRAPATRSRADRCFSSRRIASS